MRALLTLLLMSLGCGQGDGPLVRWSEYQSFGEKDSAGGKDSTGGNDSVYFDFQCDEEEDQWPYLKILSSINDNGTPYSFLNLNKDFAFSFLFAEDIEQLLDSKTAYVLIAQGSNVISFRPYPTDEAGDLFKISLLNEYSNPGLLFEGSHKFLNNDTLSIVYEDKECDTGSAQPTLSVYINGNQQVNQIQNNDLPDLAGFCTGVDGEAQLYFGQKISESGDFISTVESSPELTLHPFTGAIDNLRFHERIPTSDEIKEQMAIDVFSEEINSWENSIMWFNMGDKFDNTECSENSTPLFRDPLDTSLTPESYVAEWLNCDVGCLQSQVEE